jgi:hypothetical protein
LPAVSFWGRRPMKDCVDSHIVLLPRITSILCSHADVNGLFRPAKPARASHCSCSSTRLGRSYWPSIVVTRSKGSSDTIASPKDKPSALRQHHSHRPGESGDDKLEGPFRQLVLQPSDPEVSMGQCLACALEHRGALVVSELHLSTSLVGQRAVVLRPALGPPTR